MVVGKNILVTGGTGLIGKEVVKILVAKKYKVKVITRNEIKDKQVEYIKVDLGEPKKLKNILEDCDFVIHLAACVGEEDVDNIFYKTNVLGTKNTLESVNKKRIKKIVYVSTVSVFADCGCEVRDESWKLNTNSNNPYVKTKIEATKIAIDYSKKLPIVVVYPSIVIAKNNNEIAIKGLVGWLWKMGGGIPGALMNLIGPKERVVNYVLLENEAKGIVGALERGKVGQKYILGGENIKVSDFIKKLERYYGKRTLPIRIPLWVIKLLAKLPINMPGVVYEIDKNGLTNMNFKSDRAKNDFGYVSKKQLR